MINITVPTLKDQLVAMERELGEIDQALRGDDPPPEGDEWAWGERALRVAALRDGVKDAAAARTTLDSDPKKDACEAARRLGSDLSFRVLRKASGAAPVSGHTNPWGAGEDAAVAQFVDAIDAIATDAAARVFARIGVQP